MSGPARDGPDAPTEDARGAQPRSLSVGEHAAIGRIGASLFGDESAPPRFGRYEVVARIGAGAFGRVYRVRDPQLRRDVALKVLHPSRARADAERVVEEARAMAAVAHPNVVGVFDVGVVEGSEPPQAYIAMELVEGQSLRHWLQTQRSAAEALEVVVQAGRGLAAAHRASLVHGDFKPDNVLVGEGPRARVVDFGLARGGASAHDTGTDDVAATSPRLRGTPAYMAPELFDGRLADQLSDQFAFFVTLYEALHGSRPFEGDTPAALALAISTGELRPTDAGVPASVRRAIVRGLARHAVDRFATMDDALAALGPARRRRVVLAAGLGAAAVAAGLAIGLRDAAQPGAVEGCAPASTRLAGIWDDARRSAVGEAWATRPELDGPGTWTRTAAGLDRWSASWSDAYEDACLPVVRGDAAIPRAARVECLDEQRRAFGRVVDRLARADDATLRRAAEIVSALPEPHWCELPGPRRLVATRDDAPILGALEQAKERFVAGDHDAARRIAMEASEAAGAAGDARLRARAMGWHALATLRLEPGEGAQAGAREAHDAAARDGEPAMAAMLALALASEVGYRGQDPETGERWLREAEAQLALAGEPPRLVARGHTTRAQLMQVRGDTAAAVREAAAAVRALEAWDPQTLGLVEARANLGTMQQLAGDTETAVITLEAALAHARTALGPRNPMVGNIATNLTLPLMSLGRYRDAEQRGLEALAILGDDADALLNVAIAAQLRGEHDAARERYLAAAALHEAAHGASDPRVAQVLINLADGDARQGRSDEALAEIKRARTILDVALPQGHPVLAIVYATECLAHRVRGELDLAITRGEAGYEIARQSGDRGLLAGAALEYGDALRDRGDAAASEVLRAGIEAAASGEDRMLEARLRFSLARTRGVDEDEGAALATAALRMWPEEADPAERAQIAAWLAASLAASLADEVAPATSATAE